MRKRYRIGLALITAAVAVVLGRNATAVEQHPSTIAPPTSAPIVVQYAPSFETFPNPERGFFHQVSAFGLGTFRMTLDATTLRRYRDEGITLLRAFYILDEFRNTPLPADALNDINAHLAAARSAGIKTIPRFMYSFPCAGQLEPGQECGPATWGDTDAPLAQILAHINQLAPILHANADVIAFMEMGFVGPWGEWHNSTNGLLATTFTANQNSAAVVGAVLGALPVRRMVNLALWHQKQAITGIAAPLTAAQAFTGTPQARIGHQDDCFLATATNGNTYQNHYTGSHDPGPARQYLSEENRYVPQGGESCSFNEYAQPFVQCPTAVAELSYVRWSALNIDYQPQVIDLWRQQGCMVDIARRLGYRFRLIGAELPQTASRGSPLAFRIGIVNDGFAAPYNPRVVELVLRHSITGRDTRLPVNADPRFWGAGETHVLTLSAAVPADLASGTYEVLLNLPDPEPTLSGRPEYSIRLANEATWEPSTGYNRLNAAVTIENTGTGCSAPPPPPSGLSGGVVDGVASAAWSASPGAASYVVQAGSLPGTADIFHGSVGASLAASSPVGVGFRAFVRVYAVNACGQSGPSNEVLIQR